MNIFKAISIITLCGLIIGTASAQRICSSRSPKMCTDVTRLEDNNSPGTFYYSCLSTNNRGTTTTPERIPGTCNSQESCAALEKTFVTKLNWQGRLPVSGSRNCNGYSPY